MSVLIHIGYPKAGSTFLQHWFSSHPDIFFRADFLLPYSQTGEIPAKQMPELNSKSHFIISEEQLVLWQGKIDLAGMKFSPFDVKSQQKKVAEGLYRNFPEAKILIVTRGFESMLLSMYSQYLTMGGIMNFADYQKEMGEHLSEFYDYSFVINLYRNIFGTENVIVMPFELLKQNGENFVSAIQKEIGIKPNPDYTLEKINPSIEKKMFGAYRFTSKLLHSVMQPLSHSLQLKIYSGYVNKLSGQKGKKAMNFLSNFVREMDLEVTNETLVFFVDKAKSLSSEKLFKPYLKEYLL